MGTVRRNLHPGTRRAIAACVVVVLGIIAFAAVQLWPNIQKVIAAL